MKLSDLKDKAHDIVLADGKTYHVIFDTNAVCELEGIEEELGLSGPRTSEEAEEKPFFSFRHMRAKLWAGLLAFHSKEVPTLEAAGSLIPMDDFPRVAREIDAAFFAALAPEKKVEEGPDQWTGPSSSILSAGNSAKSSSGDQPPGN